MKLSKKILIILLVTLSIFFIIVMAIQVRPEFFNITDETLGVKGNQAVSILGSVLLMIASFITILLYRKTQEK